MAKRNRSRTELAKCGPVGKAVAIAQMRSHLVTISIAIYMQQDGEPSTVLLAHLGWMLAISAEVAASTESCSVRAKMHHTALRTVYAMALDHGKWQAAQAPALHKTALDAQTLILANAAMAMALIPDADWIASRIVTGQARHGDIAGAEVYADPVARKAAA